MLLLTIYNFIAASNYFKMEKKLRQKIKENEQPALIVYFWKSCKPLQDFFVKPSSELSHAPHVTV